MRNYGYKYSDEMYEFLCENASSHTIKELVVLLDENFNVHFDKKLLSQYCRNMHIKFKYECPKKSHSNLPTKLGTIITKTDGNYLKIKTGSHKWEPLQRKVYQDYYGVKLPEDVYVVFLNQDKRDFNIKNLKAISRRSSAIMGRDELFSTEPKITKLGYLNSKLKIKSKGGI